jgi:hypothetical protein
MRNVLIDGKGVATVCAQIISWIGLRFDNVHAIEAVATTGVGWYMGTFSAGATPDKYSSGYHRFYNCSYLHGGNQSYALAMWGANGLYNTCLCDFYGCVFRGKTTRAISIGDADHNFFFGCANEGELVFEAGTTASAGGTSPFSVGDYFAGRNNFLFGHTGPVTAKAATSGSAHSYGNMTIGHGMDLGAVVPTIEAGAVLSVHVAQPDGNLDLSGINSAGSYGNTFMGLRVAISGAQTIATGGGGAVVTWPNDPSFNFLGIFANASPTRLTVPNGISRARLTGTVVWEANATGVRYVSIRLGGSTELVRDGRPSIATLAIGATLDTGWIAVTPGQYFELLVYQDSGGDLDLLSPGTSLTMDVE